MSKRMRRRGARHRKSDFKSLSSRSLWRTRVNTSAFVITLALLSGSELSGSWAREFDGNARTLDRAVSLQELSAITAATFTLPGVPAPPPPDYRPGIIAAPTDEQIVAPVPLRPLLAKLPVTLANPSSNSRVTVERRRIFGAMEFRTRPNRIGAAWKRALERMDNELPLYAFCEQGALTCPKNFQGWRQLVSGARKLNGQKLLTVLNKGINALVTHSDDSATFGSSDHWASPLEFLDAGGDCEDFTILKYASLIELGIDERDLRIVVVKDTRRNRGHAVLSVKTPDGEMILDNLDDVVRPDTAITHYKPVYSLNRDQHWLHVAARLAKRG